MPREIAFRPVVTCPVCSEPMARVEIAAPQVITVHEITYRCEKCSAETIRVQKPEK